jgi:2',3'-cyclic-nucleotide 2'-phosphodiesterase (5'-nucleotidase family)
LKTVLLLTFLTLFSALFPAAACKAEGNEPIRLTVLFTNDVHGYIEPCG